MSIMTSEPRILNQTQDRCDSCGAEAFVQVELHEGLLLFCGHHYNKHKDALERVALVIIDETEYINKAPSASANAV